MSNSVDNMVAKLTFDNSSFEKSAAQSMSTLDKFKEKLNFDGANNGINELQKNMDGVNSAVMVQQMEAIRVKFNALNTIRQAFFTKLTQDLTEAAANFAKSVTFDNVADGFSKYEQKTSSVQTIMNATGKSIEEVNGYLEQLMWYSDETSYGFDDMVSSISQLTSAGGNIENLIPMVTGIANATAFAGKSASEFSRAIYNINQSYSAGYMQYMDWKSLDLAGISSKQLKQAFIDAAKACGTLNEAGKTANDTLVTTATFGQTLSEKWATTEVMEKAFGSFSELSQAAYEAVQSGEFDTCAEAMEAISDQYSEISVKAFEAAQQAKSFTEAVDATKDAVSSSFMRIFESVFGDYAQATILWSEFCGGLYDNFAQPIVDIEELIEETMHSSFTDLNTVLGDCGISLTDFQDQMEKTLGEDGTEELEGLIEEWGSFREVIDSGNISESALRETFEALVDEAGRVENVTLEMIKNANAADRQKLALNYVSQQAKITGSDFDQLFQSMSVPTGRTLLINAVRNALVAIIKPINAVKAGFKEAFAAFNESDALYNALEGLNKFTSSLVISDNTAEAIKNTFHALGNVISSIGKIFKNIASIISKTVTTVFNMFDLQLDEVLLTISEYLVQATEWIKVHTDLSGSIESIVDWLTTAVQAVTSWIESWNLSLDIPTIIDSVKGKVVEVYDVVKEFLKDSAPEVLEWIENLETMAKNLDLSGLIDTINDIVGAIKNGDISISVISENINKTLSRTNASIKDTIAGDIEDSLDESMSGFEEWGQKIISVFKMVGSNISDKFGLGEIISLICTGSLVMGLSSTTRATDKLAETISAGMKGVLHPVEALAEGIGKFSAAMGSGVTSVFNAITVAVKKFSANYSANILLKVAEAIGILAAAVAGLAIVYRSYGAEVEAVLFVLAELAAGLMTTVAAITLFSQAMVQFTGSGVAIKTSAVTSILALGTACLEIAIAMKKIESIDSEKAVESFVELMAGIYVIVRLINHIAPSAANALKLAPTILSLGAACIEIAFALKVLDDTRLDLTTVVALITSLGVLGGSLALLNKTGGQLKGGVGLLSIASSIAILIGCVKLLETVNWDAVTANWQAALAVGVTMGVLFGVLSASKEKFVQGGLGLAAAAAAIDLMIIAINSISEMNTTKVWKGVAALSVLMVAMGLMVSIAGSCNEFTGKAMTGLLSASVALSACTVCMILLGAMKPEKVQQGVIALGVLMLAMGTMTWIAGYAKNSVKASTFLGLATAVGVLALIMGILTSFADEQGSLLQAANALSAAMVCFGIMVALSSLANNIKFGTFAGVMVLVAELGTALYFLGTLDPESATKACKALTITMAAITVLIIAINNFAPEGVSGKALGSLAIMSAIFAAVALVLGVLDKFDLLPAADKVNALTGLFTSLGAVFTIIGALKLGAMEGIQAGAFIATAIGVGGGGIAIIAAGLQALFDLFGNEDQIYRGLDMLCTVFDKVGEMFGSLIGGIGVGITNKLEAIGKNITKFAEAIEPAMGILNGMTTNCEGASENVVTLKDVLGAITSMGNLDDVDGEALKTEMVAIAEGIGAFCQTTAGIDTSGVAPSIEAIKSLIELQDALPRTGGAAQDLAGAKDLGEFAESLEPLAFGLHIYCGAIGSIAEEDMKKVDPSATAISSLVNLLDNLNLTGGWAQTVFGEKDLGTFGDTLGALASGLSDYCSNLEYFDGDLIMSTIDPLKAIIEVVSALPRSGGVSGLLAGNKSLSSFADQLASLGKGLQDFCSCLDELSYSSVTRMEELTAAIETLIMSTGSGSINVAVSGLTQMSDAVYQLDCDLEDLADHMIEYGEDISKSLAKGMLDNMDSAVSAAKKTANAIQTAFNDELTAVSSTNKKTTNLGGGLSASWAEVEVTAQNASKDVVKTVSGTSTKLESVVGSSSNHIASATQSAIGATTKVATASVEVTSQAAEKSEGFLSRLKSAWTSGTSQLVDGASNAGQSVYTVAQALGGGLVKKSSEVLADVDEDVTDGVSGLISTLKSATTAAGDEGAAAGTAWSSNFIDTSDDAIDEWISSLKETFEHASNVISSSLNLAQAKYDLWSAQNPNASSAQSSAKEQELLKQQISLTEKEVANLQSQYDQALARYGANAYQVMDLETDLINKQIELINYQNSLSSANSESYSAYIEELTDWANNDWYGLGAEAGADLIAASHGMIDKSIDEIMANAENVSGTAKTIYTEGATSLLDDIETSYDTAGSIAVTTLSTSIVDASSTAVAAGETLGDSVVTGTDESLEDMPQEGRYSAIGLANGATCESSLAILYSAGYQMGLMLKSGYDNATKTASPAKEFIKRGKYAIDGLVIGLERNQNRVENAGADMGESLIGSTETALNKMQSVLDSTNTEYTATITPVIDTSSISNTNFGFTGSVNVGKVTNPNATALAMEEYTSRIQASNNELLAKLDSMGSSMDKHYSTQQDVQLYVDSKQLASSLAKPMSRQLNMLNTRKGQL